MNRRSLFRSLGLAAVVAGVSALPKVPKDVVLEGLPAFTKEKSEPLPENKPFLFETPWFDGRFVATPPIWRGHTIQTTGGISQLNTTQLQWVGDVPMTFTSAGAIPFDSSPIKYTVPVAERFFEYPQGGLGVEMSDGTILRRPELNSQWEVV